MKGRNLYLPSCAWGWHSRLITLLTWREARRLRKQSRDGATIFELVPVETEMKR